MMAMAVGPYKAARASYSLLAVAGSQAVSGVTMAAGWSNRSAGY
jgi:hypothetical protein